MVYNVDYFINKFSQIPEEKWITGRYGDGQGNCCALGHCGETLMDESEEADALRLLANSQAFPVARINDRDSHIFGITGATPKQRILQMLNIIKESQQNDTNR